jgi:hypothetical protein
MQEVSRVRSTNRKDARIKPKLQLPIGKGQIQRKKLDPQKILSAFQTNCSNGLC